MTMRISLFIFFLFVATLSMAQKGSYDSLLLATPHHHHHPQRQVVFGITDSDHLIVQYNPLTLLGSSLMYVYQKFVSAQLSSTCIYSPSCSEFSRQLFSRHGVFVGLLGTSDRLMRCDRISATTLSPLKWSSVDGKYHEEPGMYKLKD